MRGAGRWGGGLSIEPIKRRLASLLKHDSTDIWEKVGAGHFVLS